MQGKSLCAVGVTAVLVLFGHGTLEGEFVHCSTSLFQGKPPLISTKNTSQHLYTDYHYWTLCSKGAIITPIFHLRKLRHRD